MEHSQNHPAPGIEHPTQEKLEQDASPMNRRFVLGFLLAVLALTTPAFAGPRDADAVLNRCGKPLKGDETILEDTVAGGRRLLNYERGVLHFDKVANLGWTFTYGTHRNRDHLTAEQMEKYMPCLKDALAASAAPQPLVKITPVQRVEVSVKRTYKMLILYTFCGLAAIGLLLLIISRRSPDQDSQDESTD